MTTNHANGRKTHCAAGHAFTVENTRLIKRDSPTGLARVCRECERLRSCARRRDPIRGPRTRQLSRIARAKRKAALSPDRPARPRVLACALPEPEPEVAPALWRPMRGVSSTGGCGDLDVPRLGA